MWGEQALAPAPARLRARLGRRLAAQLRLVERPIILPASRTVYQIAQPASVDPLLDAVAGDPEQNLPYWAMTWPSGIALADEILAHPEMFSHARVLEIGSGLGITATAALSVDARLTVTDYAPPSLLLCRYNTLTNTGRVPDSMRMNWRQPPAALFSRARVPFPMVLAADVLYESRDVEPLLVLVERLVAPGGCLWLAEPGRLVAQRFVAAALARGWTEECRRYAGPWPDREDEGVVVSVHRMRRPAEIGSGLLAAKEDAFG